MQEVASQAIGVSVSGVADPAHDAGANRVEAEVAGGKLPSQPLEAAAEAADIFLREQTVGRENAVAQKANPLIAREHHALVALDPKPQALQEMLDLRLDLVKPALVIGEDQEVIDIMGRNRFFFHTPFDWSSRTRGLCFWGARGPTHRHPR